MASWADVAAEAPQLAERCRAAFDAHVHKTIATLRRDGSPRISGIELIFSGDDVWFGSMWMAVKARDLRRDPRFALHSGSDDPPRWSGDAKLAGRAVEVEDAAILDRVMREASPEAADAGHEIGSMHLFRVELTELTWIGLNEERSKLIVESWHPGRGLSRTER